MNSATRTVKPLVDKVASPHAHGGNTVTRTMFRVQLALLPATACGFWLFGWQAFFLWLLTILSCLGFEALALKMMGRGRIRRSLGDGSALLTGWLLAMSLPPWAPWWVAVVGGFIAIIAGKQVFGGVGQNVFNPAMVARVALLVSFPLPLTQWVTPLPLMTLPAPGFVDSLHVFLTSLPPPDAMASASLLGFSKTELARGIDLLHALGGAPAPLVSWLGARPGSLGESASLLILVGGGLLVASGVASWRIVLGVFLGMVAMSSLLNLIGSSDNPMFAMPWYWHLVIGGFAFGMFFMATDPVSAAMTNAGKWIFGALIGVMAVLIRVVNPAFPEGIMLAILFANLCAPLIDYAVVRANIRRREQRDACP